jgi:DNA-binding CsgD family transcriptional regulator
MLIGNGLEGVSSEIAPGPTAHVEGARELDRLLEAAEWLRKTCPSPAGTPGQCVPRLRAIVVELGPGSGIAPDSLKSFSDQFPEIAILVHNGLASDGERQNLAGVIAAFSSTRRLSPRQRLILELHLNGQNDKEIAVSLGCELTTVYEHWRRMARKSGGTGKANVVADFHRCLTREPPMTSNDE